MKIEKVEESLHPVGGVNVYHDEADSPFHIFEGYESQRATKIRALLTDFKGEIVSSDELLKKREIAAKEASEHIAAEDAKRSKINAEKIKQKTEKLTKAGFTEEQAAVIVEITK